MLTGKEFVSDYEQNKEDIEKWLSIKCPEKYQRFSELLSSKGEDPTWERIVDLYRYDKRLIFNCYRYLSFLEEYLRAIVVRYEGKEDSYDTWQESTMHDLEKRLLALLDKGIQIIDVSSPDRHILLTRKLRNAVAHNKILLEEEYRDYINSLLVMLPEAYRCGFRKKINGCAQGLNVSDKWIIKYD